MKKIFSKKSFFVLVVLIIILLIGGCNYLNHRAKQPNNFVSVQKGNVIQEVSVTGRVKPAESVDLAFEKSGKVSRVAVQVGDQVSAGQVLVALNNADLVAQLEQAQASVDNYQATLLELKKGARPEDILAKQAELKKSQQDLANYYDGVSDVLNDAYNKIDNALNAQIDLLFSNDTVDPKLTFSTTNSQAQIESEQKKLLSNTELTNFKSELNNLSSNDDLLDQELVQAEKHLTFIRDFLVTLNTALDGAVGLSSTTLDTYKTDLNLARTNVNTAVSDINNQEQNIASQKLVVERIQNELNLKLAGSTPEQIAAQEALVREAQANVKNIQAQIDKTIIHSPIKGVVTKQDAKVGEIVPADLNIVSVMAEAKFEVEANIAEVDIANVKVGDSANITLDAYRTDNIFETKVIKIDPAEIIIDGVATYKTTLQFLNEDARIKSGMTANIDILTDKREEVLILSQRAVISQDGQKIVQLLGQDQKIIQKSIVVGLRGSDGNFEIISGLKEGDKVLVP